MLATLRFAPSLLAVTPEALAHAHSLLPLPGRRPLTCCDRVACEWPSLLSQHPLSAVSSEGPFMLITGVSWAKRRCW